MMDPFSVIETALRVLQLVKLVAKQVSFVTEQIRQDARKALEGLEIELQMKINVEHMESWLRLWCTEGDKSEDFYQTLWGWEGYNETCDLLNSIHRDCSQIGQCVKALNESIKVTGTRHQLIRNHKWWKIIVTMGLSLGKQKFEPDGEHLYDATDRLSDAIDKLWETSERHFRSLHGITPNKSEDLRTVGPQSLLQCATHARLQAAEVYTFCRSWQTDFSLELNMLNHDQDVDAFPDLFDWSDLRPSYHLLLHNGMVASKALDVIVEPCEASTEAIDCPEESNLMQESDFVTTLCDTNLGLKVRLPSTTALHTDLHLHITHKCKSDYVERNEKPVFSNAGSTSMFQFTTHDKISFAYSLVECSLFLLGTPWLSHLSSENLEKWERASSGRTYALRIRNRSELDKIDESPTALEQYQIWRIGVLLIGIAVEKAFQISGATALSDARSALPAVELLMDPRYTQACRFCVEMSCPSNVYKVPSAELPGLDGPPGPSSLFQNYYYEVFTR
jgi:hypothetical protein